MLCVCMLFWIKNEFSIAASEPERERMNCKAGECCENGKSIAEIRLHCSLSFILHPHCSTKSEEYLCCWMDSGVLCQAAAAASSLSCCAAAVMPFTTNYRMAKLLPSCATSGWKKSCSLETFTLCSNLVTSNRREVKWLIKKELRTKLTLLWLIINADLLFFLFSNDVELR